MQATMTQPSRNKHHVRFDHVEIIFLDDDEVTTSTDPTTTATRRRQMISLHEYEKLVRCSSHTDRIPTTTTISTKHRPRHHHRRHKRQNTTDKDGFNSNHEQRLRDIFNQVEQLNDHVEQLLHKYCDDPSSTVLTLPPTPPRPSKRKQHHTIGRKQQHGCYYRNSHGMKKVTLMARSA